MVRRKITWSKQAVADLEAIIKFLAEKNKPASFKLREEILSATASLGYLPVYHAYDPYLLLPYRRMVIKRYHIIYRELSIDEVVIIQIFDGRQSPTKKHDSLVKEPAIIYLTSDIIAEDPSKRVVVV